MVLGRRLNDSGGWAVRVSPVEKKPRWAASSEGPAPLLLHPPCLTGGRWGTQAWWAPVEDFATLKRDIAAEVKDVKREVTDLGQSVEILQQAHDAWEEEVDSHIRELLVLQDKNQELQYQLEDLENRSR
ncbi:hypothetical protein NDU88_008298 [Pleurodeles waltl]|uniref:Uncharacterized protein n=1 Tax=Pleurodeles waltl TaxID=8319 RepID=A0AAV7QS54_PLEWA|nr:hypothetical protein NDU88_008298 [Pleurodeles waltl]